MKRGFRDYLVFVLCLGTQHVGGDINDIYGHRWF